MHLLITGIAGFVGSTIAKSIVERGLPWQITGIDNLCRRGSETNLETLRHMGVRFVHGDIRSESDLAGIPKFDWLLDAAANPSVLAGADGKTSSRQLMEHNLIGTINMLERCKATQAGFILLSTSRVYSIKHLASLALKIEDNASVLDSSESQCVSDGADTVHTLDRSLVTPLGIAEAFPTTAPISLYGASKLTSEALALEYGETFGFPVWINRCGVLAGAGQFGRADQGIFAYWINSHLRKKPLKYIGFEGQGYQVRDCLHPRDLVDLIEKQTSEPSASTKPRLSNVSGGLASAMSLRQLTDWCNREFGLHPISSDTTPRPFDLPWVVLNSAQAQKAWDWQPTTSRSMILQEIANHARANPHWLQLST